MGETRGLVCDRCDRSLLVHEDVRYEVVIRVTAAYDPLELDLDAIADHDLTDELARLGGALASRSAQELEDEVWKELRFDLCGRCQREYLRDAMPKRSGPDRGT